MFSKHVSAKNSFISTLEGILGLMTLAIIGYWVFSVVFDKSNYSGNEECGFGYHIEGYVTPYGETITECFEN